MSNQESPAGHRLMDATQSVGKTNLNLMFGTWKIDRSCLIFMILFLAVQKVFKSDGISALGRATTP